MGKNQDHIPVNAGKFDAFFKKIAQYVSFFLNLSAPVASVRASSLVPRTEGSMCLCVSFLMGGTGQAGY
jgi:hypothetical protein